MTLSDSRRHFVVLACGYALSAAAVLGLLGRYQVYEGQPASQRVIVIFLLPVTATVIWTLIHSLQRRRAPAQENGAADAAIRDIVFWVVLFLVSVHAVMLGVLHGHTWIQPWASRAVVLLSGLVTISVGNQLPRTRPNMALGIRTVRTLSDRRLWMLTHRVTGYTAVVLGLITVSSGLLLPRERVAAVPGTAFLVSLAWLSAFYWTVSHRDARA